MLFIVGTLSPGLRERRLVHVRVARGVGNGLRSMETVESKRCDRNCGIEAVKAHFVATCVETEAGGNEASKR